MLRRRARGAGDGREGRQSLRGGHAPRLSVSWKGERRVARFAGATLGLH
jgi:hypothetical protein